MAPPKTTSNPNGTPIPKKKQSLCSKLCRIILILWLISILLPTLIIAGLLAYITPLLYREFIPDSPFFELPGSEALTAILYPNSHPIQLLTTYTHKSILHLTDDQTYMTHPNSHAWVYITGREGCKDDLTDSIDPTVCEKWDESFATLAERYYLTPLAQNASLSILDCDISPLLCSAWALEPPALLRFESLGAPHCQISFSSFTLLCPYGVRFIPLPTGPGFTEILGAYRPVGEGLTDEMWQLQTLFESSCAHEVYEIQRGSEFVGNGGEVEEWGEVLGGVVVGWPVAEWLGMVFAWWRVEVLGIVGEWGEEGGVYGAEDGV